MLRKFYHLVRTGFLLTAIASVCLTAVAQKPSSATTKKTKAVNESCDGALDIVPTKAMTFARKRRPSQGEAKERSAPDSKEPPIAPKSEKQRSGSGR
ncbi:MAG: hypothetical protein L0226_18035 [Acidobacteria bacterium]|nr:hypothetical protein [Acidobacteriota bacterium]